MTSLSTPLALALSLLFAPTALAGDVLIRATGTVSMVVGTPEAPFTAAATGDAVELIVEAIDAPTVISPQFWMYELDLTTGGLTIGSTFARVATVGSGQLDVQNDTPADGFTIGVPIEVTNFGAVAVSIVDPFGNILSTVDVTQLVGTTLTSTPLTPATGLLSGGSGTYSIFFDITQLEISPGTCPRVGDNYCPSNGNSSGRPAGMAACGSVRVADDDVELLAHDLPLNAFGFFLTSQTMDVVSNPGGSAGNLCLGGSIGRFVGPGQVQSSGTEGRIRLALDLQQQPTPTGPVAVAPGDTWYFTAWFRDSVGGVATSNFADGLEIVFE